MFVDTYYIMYLNINIFILLLYINSIQYIIQCNQMQSKIYIYIHKYSSKIKKYC